MALRDRLEALSEEVRGLRATLAAGAPPPAVAAAAVRAAEDSGYSAFESRFRGRPEELRERLSSYVALFEGLSPVVDLGCGRGEFLELLKEKGLVARGVEASAHAAADCRSRGLDVSHGDLVEFLRGQPDASLGGVFAAQVAEHLTPPALQALLREAHRALRPGGLLALETVNPRSVVGLLEVFNRDLTHEKPLHPDTLSFLAAAAGFTDVRVEMRSPVEPAARLQPVPADGLPPRTAAALNENVARLNDLLYAPQEYALLARR
jgi:O-antigen chain-terminating methyltransferase